MILFLSIIYFIGFLYFFFVCYFRNEEYGNYDQILGQGWVRFWFSLLIGIFWPLLVIAMIGEK